MGPDKNATLYDLAWYREYEMVGALMDLVGTPTLKSFTASMIVVPLDLAACLSRSLVSLVLDDVGIDYSATRLEDADENLGRLSPEILHLSVSANWSYALSLQPPSFFSRRNALQRSS